MAPAPPSHFNPDQTEGDPKQYSSFFSWYYLFLNIGAIGGESVCPLLRQHVDYYAPFAAIVGLQVCAALWRCRRAWLRNQKSTTTLFCLCGENIEHRAILFACLPTAATRVCGVHVGQAWLHTCGPRSRTRARQAAVVVRAASVPHANDDTRALSLCTATVGASQSSISLPVNSA